MPVDRRRSLGLLALAGIAAASPVPAAGPPPPVEAIAGRRWIVTTVEPAREGETETWASWDRVAADLTLDAATASAAGSGGCNRWRAGFASEAPGRLRFSGAASTMMACLDPGFMERERAFLEALERITTYRLDQGRLLLEGPAGLRITLAAAPA